MCPSFQGLTPLAIDLRPYGTRETYDFVIQDSAEVSLVRRMHASFEALTHPGRMQVDVGPELAEQVGDRADVSSGEITNRH